MEGMNPNFPGGIGANMLQQMSSYNNIQSLPNGPVSQQQQQPPNMASSNISSELNPKRQAVFDRLKKRVGGYRKRQNESIPRFEQTFSGICEQQSIETNVLQKRFVESKAKRVAKKADKKATDVTPNNVTVTQTKQMKRSAMDDLENDGDILPPAAKIPATGNNTAIDNMKFQVEIVQQLEFTTSVANLQPQQISTNVTVKAMTNGSVKYEPQEMKPQQKMEPQKMQGMPPLQPPVPDILHDFKQEPDNEFADLDFGDFANLMANHENEMKSLFSNIEVFDQDLFDQDKIKQEPQPPQIIPQMTQQNVNQMNQLNQQFNHYVMPESCQMQKSMMQPQVQQVQQQQQQPPPQHQRMYQQQQVPQQQMPDMTHAAQALKNMAQQHQVKNSMNYMRPVAQPMVPQINQQQQQPQPNHMTQRMPYQQQPQQQFNDYSGQFLKNTIQMPFPPDMIKQEMMMQQQQQQPQMSQPQMAPMMNQQYPQYQNTQFVANHQTQQQPQQRNNFQGQNTMNIHMKQTQMMHIHQPNGGGNIQMQGGQHMHFAGDMKMSEGANFTMQQQQNMYFNNHHTHQPNTHPQYGNMQAMQKRPQHHQPMGGGGEGPNNTYNMMQSQSMSFTQ